MATDTESIDTLIDNLGGFGAFQILLIFMTTFVRVVGPMSFLMMAFGNYNPGLECMDHGNATTKDWNATNNFAVISTKSSNDSDECHIYSTCDNVQFKGGISTIVTEWQLVCNKSWITSLIISIQMLGVLIGSFLSGYLGDRLGRKRTLVIALCGHLTLNIIAIFSNSWYMFLVMRFLIGIPAPILVYTPVVLLVEFVPCKWRAAILSFPTFSIGCTIFALTAMVTRDWKYVHGTVAFGSFIALIPFYWIPDSLRWLVIKNKTEDAVAVVRKMAKLNGKKVNEGHIVKELTNLYTYNGQPQTNEYTGLQLVLQLLRKGVRYPTFIAGLLCVTMSMIYYVIGFGVKSMPGNFFTNLILVSSADIPFSPVSATLPNYIGRKLSIIIFIAVCTMSLFVIAGLDLGTEGSIRTVGILICVIIIRMLIEPAWDVTVVYVGEVYPTVMRNTSIAYTSWVSRIGGILAPYLIPDSRETYFISFLVLAVCALVCCVLVIFLRETKGEHLKDIWHDSVVDPTQANDCQKSLTDEQNA